MIKTSRILFASAAIALIANCHVSANDKISRSFVSPDKAFVAVLVSEIGEGFPSSTCVDTVYVVPNKPSASGNYPSTSRAYVGACHALKMQLIDGKRGMPNAPQLRWTAPRELSIVFDPKQARTGIRTFHSVTSLLDGAIVIRNLTQ